MQTIQNRLFAARGFTEAALTRYQDRRRFAMEWLDWNIDTVCGEAVEEITARTEALIEIVDPAAYSDIWAASVGAMLIVCNG